MLAKTAMNRLITIRIDILSNRTYSLKSTLQGTKGCFETSRHAIDIDKVWIKDLSSGEEWMELDALYTRYVPELW